MNSPRLWTKDFIIIFGTNFFTHIVFYMLMVVTAMYTIATFHTNQAIAGLATGLYVLASLVARLFAGKYMDAIGRKKTLIISLAVFTMAMGLHLFISSLLMLFLLRIVHGASHGFVTTTAGAIAAELIPDERRGEGTGYYATGMNIAMAIGPFLGLYLYTHASFEMIFLAGVIISFIDLVTTAFITVLPLKTENRSAKGQKHFALTQFIEPKAVPISLVIFMITLAYSSLMTFLSSYAKEIHLVGVSSFFFIVYAVALLATRPFTGRWFDSLGANKVTYPLIICLAAGFALLSAAHNSVTFLLSGALIGIGYGTVLSNFQAIAILQSPSAQKALATSTSFIFLDLANGFGTYVIGLLVSGLSFRMVYLLVAVVILLSSIAYYFAYGKKTSQLQKLHSKNMIS